MLRYVGGETRIVSVDRNIGFLKLRSKILELCPNSLWFSLKYQLPELDATNGDHTTTNPLVSIVSDDDVRCMIDEYDKLESYGKHARLWLYVCSDNRYVKDDTNMSDVYVNCAKNEDFCINNGAGGRRMSFVKSVSALDESYGETHLWGVKYDGKGGKLRENNIARGDEFSLRKMVLKTQLLAKQPVRIEGETEDIIASLGNKSYVHQLIDLASEPQTVQTPTSQQVTTQIFEKRSRANMLNCGITVNSQLPDNQDFGNLVHFPASHLYPLNARDGNLSSTMQCFSEECGQVMSNSATINGGNSNGSVISSMPLMSTGSNVKQESRNTEPGFLSNLNRENVVPLNADCNSRKIPLAPLYCSNQLVPNAYPLKFSYTGHRVWGGPQGSIRNRRVGVSDARNQRACSHYIRAHQSNFAETGDHRNVKVDGRPSVGRYHPGLRPSSNISKQGQAVRSYYPNSWKPCSASRINAMEGTVRMGSTLNTQTSSGLQYEKEYTREGVGGLTALPYAKQSPKECQLAYNGARIAMDDQSLLSFDVAENPSPCISAISIQEDLLTYPNSETSEIKYHNLSENFYGVAKSCKPLCCDTKKEAVVIDPKDFVNIPSSLNSISYSNGSELGHDSNPSSHMEAVKSLSNHYSGTYISQGGITSSVGLSLYNLSLSSRQVEPPPLLMKPQSERLDIMDEEQFSSGLQVELTNGVTSNSSSPSATKLGQDPLVKDEMQQDPPSLSTNEKADIKESHKSSKAIVGISNDLAGFYTHVATRELQAIKFSDLECIKELGSGTYGTVFYGKWKGSDVAIKRIKPSCFTEGALEEDRLIADFWREAHILGQLHHPNIVALYGVVTDGPVTNLATVTEYMVNGSLKQVLRRKDRTIDRRKRFVIAMDTAFGMEYLHEKNIVHFDLKSHNLLVNMKDPQRPVCKIGDLGLSKIKQRTLVSGGVRGTIPWMAPELLKNNLVTEKIDVYSFGVVMWELLTGEEPYANLRSEEIITGIIKGNLRPEIPSWCDPSWRSLMERCWLSDPNSRPPFSEIAKELRIMSAAMNIK